MQKTYSAKVQGMTCGNCALTISRMLEKKGAQHISANAASGEVNFTTAEEADVKKMYDAIDDLGYHVVRENDADTAHTHAGEHEHGDQMTKLLIFCLLLTVPLLMHMFVSWPVLHMPWVQFALATPVYAVGVYVFGTSAVRSLKHGLPNMDVLIVLGASAAYIYSLIGILFYSAHAHDYLFFETTASIITLVMVGNWLEHNTVKSTTSAIDALVKLQPAHARVIMTDSLGKETILDIESQFVREGDKLLVNHGDNIPVDGRIVHGDAQVDEHMITGESLPVHKHVGEDVIGGTLVLDGNIRIEATNVGGSSVLSNIIRMVREAQATKPPLQKLADKISAVFVPLVLGIAVVTLLGNYFAGHLSFEESMMRSIAVMVIACPCAMGLATPAAIAVGLGRAAKNGMLVKGGDTLEQLKKIRQVVFDKTGTLTTGKLHIEAFVYEGMDERGFRSVVSSIETHSSHPIAKSVVNQWRDADQLKFEKIEELKGKGIQATDKHGVIWKLGSEKWLRQSNAPEGYDLYLYKNDGYAGALRIADTLRDDAAETIASLKKMGYKTILLSGDKKTKCEYIAKQLGIDEVYAEHSPEQKNTRLDELMKTAPTMMVGDGINDAPALAKATVGVSLSESTQIAIQSADIILSGNKLSALPKAIRLGIYTEQTIIQNLFWAFLYNVIAIPVAALGYLKPTYGAGVMALSDVILVINSLRLGIRRLGN